MDPEVPSPSVVVRGWDEQLRARGYRVTPQRQLVLEAVARLDHATPEEIGAQVQQTARGVNISTIYRTLDLLEQIGSAIRTRTRPDDQLIRTKITGQIMFALDSPISALGSDSLAVFFNITGPICARSAKLARGERVKPARASWPVMRISRKCNLRDVMLHGIR